MNEELSQLNHISEGMKALAEQQGADFKEFVDHLNSSLDRHSQLLKDFEAENVKLRENKKAIQVNSLVGLANTFATWDRKPGLSIEEFNQYLEMLGQDFKKLLFAKYSSIEEVFKRLDTDNSGSLSVSEVRVLILELVDGLNQKDGAVVVA